MSGIKYSSIQIQRELREKQKCIVKLNEIKMSIGAIKENIKKILDATPEGVKSSFSKEIVKIENWLKEEMQNYNKNMNIDQLTYILNEYKKMIKRGEGALSELVEIIEVKREKKAKEVLKYYQLLKSEISANQNILEKWESEEYIEINKKLDAIYSFINKENFKVAEEKLANLKNQVDNLKLEVNELEDKNNQRQYVIDALRKVCRDMGWDEIEIRNLNNPKETVILKVDTYTAGKMTFYLNLDRMKVESPLTKNDGVCLKDFDKVSEKLKKFGVETQFKIEGEEPEPKLIQKGELDLPEEGEEQELER